MIAFHSQPALAGCCSITTNPTNRFNVFVAAAKPLKRLSRRQWPRTATQLEQGVNERTVAQNPQRIKSILVLLGLTMLTGCQPASSRAPLSISAHTLAAEYERSSAAVRSKYDGKEIIVRGYTAIAATMPRSIEDQGSLLLTEKDRNLAQQIACWFSKDQNDSFSKIRAGQYVTVKGVFNGEAGANLKFCKLVKVE